MKSGIRANSILLASLMSIGISMAAIRISQAAGPAGQADNPAGQTAEKTYSWQEQHAKVLPTGDLEWSPKPFVFEKGKSVKYIDFETGSDDNDGASREKPWKHHPWDANAAGKAKECKGIHTYVFKRGVTYRGQLIASESGQAGDPIRLTSDPEWGKGEAFVYGSEPATGWQKGGHDKMPDKDKVWRADLNFSPRLVCAVDKDGKITRLKLARTPNWEITDPDNVYSNCWSWENPKWWENNRNNYKVTVKDHRALLAVDTKHLTGQADYYEGALVWSEWGIVMCSPYAAPVEMYDAEKKAIAFQGPWFGDSGEGIATNHRYWLEDKPHYLDEAGEFWFEKKADGGTLYVRLPGDADPSTVTVEAAKHTTIIDSKGVSHLDISGLSFRFGNIFWNLDYRFFQGDVDTAGVRMIGSGSGISVRNCRFDYMAKAVLIRAPGKDNRIDNISVCDNEINCTDHGAIEISDGTGWGQKDRPSSVGAVKVLRNKLSDIGMRPYRPNGYFAIQLAYPETAEVAGNFVDRCGGAGIFIEAGKFTTGQYDVPFNRVLVHHNKVTNSLLIGNDWGGIETNQGGSYYVFDNVSGNPVGLMHWNGKTFGHAYYVDGGFKAFHFNNIAWGKCNDPKTPIKCNTSAFQEIHSYQNTFFNNTAYKFQKGTRRQAPQAGRDKWLGNIFQDIADIVFRHSDVEGKDPNARDAGAAVSNFAYETNAYSHNVFSEIGGKFGVFESKGGDYPDLASFAKAMGDVKAMASDVGVMDAKPSLRDAAAHDFRPAPGSAAIGTGVKVFVPWGLYGTVGEWHFTVNKADPATIIDEHWYLKAHMNDREKYYLSPMYPLKAVNVKAENYEQGPLEDWTTGALKLNGKDQYLVLANVPRPKAAEVTMREVKEKWFTASAPAACQPGTPFEFKITVQDVPADSVLAIDINCLKGNSFGGFLAKGGEKKLDGPGPHVFKLNLPDEGGVTKYVLTVYASPDGKWNSKTHNANVEIERLDRQVDFDPQVDKSNFLVEAYLKVEQGGSGIITEKLSAAGYSLAVNDKGLVEFSVQSSEGRKSVASAGAINDGKYHHVIAEADRKARTLTIYLDGKKDASAEGLGDVSLANDSDTWVCGSPKGRNLAATLEFLRISRGTLADAKTTIEELYAWQFDGPFLRDFCGVKPAGKRDAGAIQSTGDSK